MEGREGEAGNDVKSNRPFSLGGGETLIRMKMWFNEDENGNCAWQLSPHVPLSQGAHSGSLKVWNRKMGEEDLVAGKGVVRPQFPHRGSSQMLYRAPLGSRTGSRCRGCYFPTPYLVLNYNTANSGIKIVTLFIEHLLCARHCSNPFIDANLCDC